MLRVPSCAPERSSHLSPQDEPDAAENQARLQPQNPAARPPGVNDQINNMTSGVSDSAAEIIRAADQFDAPARALSN